MFTPSRSKDNMYRCIKYHPKASQLDGGEAQEDTVTVVDPGDDACTYQQSLSPSGDGDGSLLSCEAGGNRIWIAY